MRIALLAPLVTPIREPQLGGSQALLSDLAAGLASRGHEVDVFAASGSRIEGANVVDTGVDPSELAGTLFRPDEPGADSPASRAAFARAWRMIADGRYDLAHNHAFDLPAVGYAEGAGCAVVHTLHLPASAQIGEAVAAAQAGPRAPLVCCVSRTHARLWSAHVRVDAVLRNGIPVGEIPWSAEPGSGAVFAGRFSPEKGAAEAIDIAVRAGLEVTLYGSAYDAAYVEDNIDPWRGRQGVRIEDPLPRRELWRRLSRAAVVLCPALWDEPFGLVAAEAQACGTPVVGFRRGGLVEIVWESVTGALVPGEDLVEAAEEASRAHAYDRAAIRRHAEASLDIAAMLDDHEALYDRIAGGRGG